MPRYGRTTFARRLRGSYGDKVLVEFTVDSELFVGTDNHPIWVVNGDAWVHAEGLQVGDQVSGLTNKHESTRLGQQPGATAVA